MGVLIGSAVCPIAFCMVWSKCTSTGAISGALVGLVAAVCGWLGYTKANYGAVNLTTSGAAAHALSACGWKLCAHTSRFTLMLHHVPSGSTPRWLLICEDS